MHSRYVSIFSSISKRSRAQNSSTDIGLCLTLACPQATMLRTSITSHAREVLCLPKACLRSRSKESELQPVDARRERKESIKSSRLRHSDSNRKETQISAFAPLFNWANTSGIRLFADPQRQSSAWADDMVMDRGAEGAARGCDAV